MLLLPFALGQSIFDPAVFNFYFYCNTDSDLVQSVCGSVASAQQHWAQFGVHEGRQATSPFHTQQYLDRYPDLKQAFGNNFTAAIYHYLTRGISEGRVGYLEGGGYGRYTVAANGIYVSASQRMAGAIDSVVWGNVEFINAWDHGRELQYAVTVGKDGFPNEGECYNPTEAGSGHDLQQASTTSVLLAVKAAGNMLSTSVKPAFWMIPGEQHANPTPACTVARNTELVSQYVTTKTVTVGGLGLPGNAIDMNVTITIPDALSNLQVEAPTGYMTGDFTSFFAVDTNAGTATPVSTDAGEIPQPLMFCNPAGTACQGAFSKSGGCSITYAKFQFIFPELPNSTNKWSIVCRSGAHAPNSQVSMRSFVCIGSRAAVLSCMQAVSRT